MGAEGEARKAVYALGRWAAKSGGAGYGERTGAVVRENAGHMARIDRWFHLASSLAPLFRDGALLGRFGVVMVRQA
jgi:hypothetical protein